MAGLRKHSGTTEEWVFRHCAPTHTDLAGSLRASQRVGGRFNPPRVFGAVYATADRETAVRELDRTARRLGRTRSDLMPRTLLTLHLRAQHVLDLTDPAVQAAWDLTTTQLTQDDWAACQEVGRAAYRANYEAIRFPAAGGSGVNYAVFLDHLIPGSELSEVHREDLTS